MIHLFNKIYLENEKYYSTHFQHEFLYTEETEHPIGRSANKPIGMLPAFADQLAKNHHSSMEMYWESLLNRDSTHPYVLFADSKIFINLLLTYWKSVFPKATSDDFHLLYKFYHIDSYLKKNVFIHLGNSVFDYSELTRAPLGLEEFSAVMNGINPSPTLQRMDKGKVGFEFLLADYFYNPQSRYAPAFRERLKYLSLRSWFFEMEELKSEIYLGFYDIKSIFPDADVDPENPDSVLNFIQNDRRISWTVDPDFNTRNYAEVFKKYDKSLFLYLIDCLKTKCGASPKKLAAKDISDVFLDNLAVQTELIYAGNFTALLDHDIQKSFGCVFIHGKAWEKANQLFPNYLYDRYRSKESEALAGYSLT